MRFTDTSSRFYLSIKKQLSASLPAAVAVLAVSVAITIGTYTAARILHTPLFMWVYDPSRYPGVPLYFGYITFLAVWGWAGAAAICLFNAVVLSRGHRTTPAFRFMLVAGLLTFFLGMDDTFLFHEEVLPEYFGIPEPVVLLIYIATTGAFLFSFRRMILIETPYLLLAGALTFFCLSVGIDLSPFEDRFITFIEDCLKLTGILFWLAYFSKAGMDWLACKD